MSSEPTFTPAVFAPLHRSGRQSPERESSRVQGYAAGYAAGARAAEAEARAEREELARRHAAAEQERERRLADAVGVLHRSVRAFDQRIAAAVAEAGEALSGAALDLAEAILGAELRDGEAGARAALGRALSNLAPADVREVRLHPDDLAALPAGTAEAAGVRLVADHTLARGDALAVLPDGFLDARIATALERCRAALEPGTTAEARP